MYFFVYQFRVIHCSFGLHRSSMATRLRLRSQHPFQHGCLCASLLIVFVDNSGSRDAAGVKRGMFNLCWDLQTELTYHHSFVNLDAMRIDRSSLHTARTCQGVQVTNESWGGTSILPIVGLSSCCKVLACDTNRTCAFAQPTPKWFLSEGNWMFYVSWELQTELTYCTTTNSWT